MVTVDQLVDQQLKQWDVLRFLRLEGPAVPRRQPVEDFVSISRAAAAGGEDVAAELARRLGWPVLDKQLLELMAGSDALRRRIYESMDERDTTWLEDAIADLMPSWPIRHGYFHRLAETVLSVARQGRTIFLGRAADLILPRGVGFRLRVTAPHDACVRILADARNIPRMLAQQEFERQERERETFIRKHFAGDPYDERRFDLVLNMEHLTAAGAADVVMAALRARGMVA